jgi:hypothetical protein
MEDKQVARNVALLAPVPLDILESALQTDTPDGQMAFATMDWQLFNELEKTRSGLPVDAFIYASHPDGSLEGKATWLAGISGLSPKSIGLNPTGRPWRYRETTGRGRFIGS